MTNEILELFFFRSKRVPIADKDDEDGHDPKVSGQKLTFMTIHYQIKDMPEMKSDLLEDLKAEEDDSD